jgi:hypothetical protein
MTDLVGHHLVDGDAGLDVGASRLLDAHAREKVPPARAWSPAPSGPASALTQSRPAMTWSDLRTLTSGASVGESAKSAPPSPAGHQAAGMAPFGT